MCTSTKISWMCIVKNHSSFDKKSNEINLNMGHTQHTKVYTSFPQVISHYETLQQIITNCGISMQVAAWALITPPPLIFKQNKLKIRRRGGGLLCLTPSECSYTAGHRFGVPWPYGTIHYLISINILTKIFLSFQFISKLVWVLCMIAPNCPSLLHFQY